MISKKLFSLVAGIMILATFGAQAQNMTVRGTVKDAAGPVVGAVVLSGGANAVTDFNGAYTITVPSNAVLEVSCLGYADQQIPVNGRSVIDIILQEDTEMLQAACHFMAYDLPRVREQMRPYANRHASALQKADDSGWQHVSAWCVPQQYGYNGISIDPPAPGSTVEVSLRGEAGPVPGNDVLDDGRRSDGWYAENAAWSFALVGVMADGTCIYSEAGFALMSSDSALSDGSTVIFHTPSDRPLAYLWLVVVPTPKVHQYVSEEAAAGYIDYPYSVKIDRKSVV